MKIINSLKFQLLPNFFALVIIMNPFPGLLKAQSFILQPEANSLNSSISHLSTNSDVGVSTHTSYIEEGKKTQSSIPGFYENKGYMSFVSFGLLPGSQDVMTTTPISLDMSHGYYNPSGVYTGAGIAVETFDPSIMPVFIDLRFFFTKGNAKPWIGTRLGYAIPLSGRPDFKEKGGAYAGAGGGMIFSISSSAAFYFYFGYRYQKLTATYSYYNGNETKQITEFNRMEFKVGLSFH